LYRKPTAKLGKSVKDAGTFLQFLCQ